MSHVGAVGVGSTTGVEGVEGVLGVGATGAAVIIAVASESLVIAPIEFVAVTATRMYLSTSPLANVYVALVAPEILVQVVSSSGSAQRFHW